MTSMDIPAPDGAGTLHALRFGPDDATGVVLAAHGITASAMSFAAVARALPPGWSLVALDLRGRGRSDTVGGPFGMDQHARDLAAVATSIGRPVVLTGQSLGAYAALRAAARFPELFTKVVLVDGGLPLPVPPDADPDAVLEATVGPAIARLRMTFASEEDYVAFFRQHPALTGDWSDDLTAYVRYDIAGAPPAIRSRVNPDAFAADGRDLLVNAAIFGDDLSSLRLPAHLLYAPSGMLGAPPGLMPQPLVDHWAGTTSLTAQEVPDSNHYTILFGAKAAEQIAQALTAAVPPT